MARLEQAIATIVDLFMEYSGEEGKKRQLNKEELKKLLQEEIKSPEFKVRHSVYMICTSTDIKITLSCFWFTI